MSMVETGDCWDGGEFDILNLLDFPMESLEDDGYAGDWDNSNSQFLEPIPLLPCGKIDTVPSYSSLGPVALINGSPERKPNYIKQSSSLNVILHDVIVPEVQESTVFQTESPISVLESSGSCSSGKSITSTIPTRPRSKRARPMGSTPWAHLSPPLSSSKMAPNVKKNKEQRKVVVSSDLPDGYLSHRPGLTKKCTHCEITKTPQWREGPLGPKTLCNACGVRYRSGRLFPEYRPAASPTFVPSLHSNSHKKVIEMRSKGKRAVTEMEYPPVSPLPEFVPASSSMFDFMYN